MSDLTGMPIPLQTVPGQASSPLLNQANRELPQLATHEQGRAAVPQERADHPPAGDVRFRDYLLQNVYLRTTQTERSEIIALWFCEEALDDPAEAKRRSHEAVFLVRSASGELAGLSTVGFVRLKEGRTFYNYRMFLRKGDRVPNLMMAVVLATREFLRTFQHPERQSAGLLHINENPKLLRPGMRRVFERIGHRYWGKTPLDEEVWGVEFAPQTGTAAQPARSGEAVKRRGEHREPDRDDIPTLDLV
jgi:hypothetical protein